MQASPSGNYRLRSEWPALAAMGTATLLLALRRIKWSLAKRIRGEVCCSSRTPLACRELPGAVLAWYFSWIGEAVMNVLFEGRTEKRGPQTTEAIYLVLTFRRA
ncbi:hypothetical protein B0O99DRAFT_591732 [Bisporella sp. PMI_857]|nr:hypothetical protein B0O99DRAFT_591732 [Bisporella sp. PMI_857]